MKRIKRVVVAAAIGVCLAAAPGPVANAATTEVAPAAAPAQEQQQPDEGGGESYWGLLGLLGLVGLAGLGGRRRESADHRRGGSMGS